MYLIYLVLYNYFLVFGVKNLFKTNYETTSRIASLSHSIVSTLLSSLFLFNIINYDILVIGVWYNVIYITMDIYLYMYNKISNKDKIEMMFHHIVFLIASYYSSLNPYFYSRGILTESSTIFLNLSWLIKNIEIIKNKNLKLLSLYLNKNIKILYLLIWITFAIFRIINMDMLLYEMYYSKYSGFSTLPIPFIILNKYWFYLINKKIFNNLIM